MLTIVWLISQVFFEKLIYIYLSEHLYNHSFHYNPTIPSSIKLEFWLKCLDIN